MMLTSQRGLLALQLVFVLLACSVRAVPSLGDLTILTNLDDRTSESSGGYVTAKDTFVMETVATRTSADEAGYTDSKIEFKIFVIADIWRNMQTPTQLTYKCNLTECPPADTASLLCYCYSNTGDDYTLRLNVQANIGDSEDILRTSWQQSGTLTPITVVSNNITMPVVCDQVSGAKVSVTYQGGEAKSDITGSFTTLTIPKNAETIEMTFTISGLGGGSTLSITSDDGKISASGTSVTVTTVAITSEILGQNFTLMYSEPSTGTGCGRSNAFVVLLEAGSSPGGDDTGLIVGIIFAVLAGILIVVLLLFYCPRPRVICGVITKTGVDVVWTGPILRSSFEVVLLKDRTPIRGEGSPQKGLTRFNLANNSKEEVEKMKVELVCLGPCAEGKSLWPLHVKKTGSNDGSVENGEPTVNYDKGKETSH